MRRYLMMALLAVCLAAFGLSGEARAEEGTYPVDGMFCYRDVDGVLKPIPYGWMTLGYRENESDQETEHSGAVRDGIFMIPESFDTKRPGIYTIRVSCYGPNQTAPVSCGSDTVTIRVVEQGASFGEVELTLHMNLPVVVYDADHKQLGEFKWSLWRGQEEVGSGTAEAVGDYVWAAAPELRLDWERYELRLEKTGYQTAVYELCPVMDADGNIFFENGLDTTALRLVPTGALVQPTPTDLRYAGGVVSWRTSFIVPEGSTGNSMRWSQIELTNCETGESTCSTMSGDFGGSYDIFEGKPDWESGTYLAKVTALAQPYYTTYDSDPAILRFYYEKPKGYLPDVQGPRWLEGSFPAMTWGYDTDLLKYVKEFYVIPRVSDSAPAWNAWDFAHEYLGDRWKGAFRVAPSQSGVYQVPELMEAVRGYGEGWYVFEVGVVSGSEEWRDPKFSAYTEFPYHYVPSIADPVKNGTVVSMDRSRVKWTLNNQSRVLTVSKVPENQAAILVASYDENGRFQGIQTVRQDSAVNLSRAASARMFWMDSGAFSPQARVSEIISAAG